MNELFYENQEFSIVPQNFKFANKGRVIDILENSIVMKLDKPPEGLEKLKINEYYSQTKHGTLYFSSAIARIDADKRRIVVMKPRKHRFLQRRTYTRIKYIEHVEFKLDDKTIEGTTIDLAAGGIKARTNECLSLDKIYDVCLPLAGGDDIICRYQPIKMERVESENMYISAGKLVEISQKDKMRIIQYCLRKDIEYNKR